MWCICQEIQESTLCSPLSSLLVSAFLNTVCSLVPAWWHAMLFHHFPKVQSVPSKCQQQQAMLGSPCFGKAFMSFAGSRQIIETPLSNVKLFFFWFRELLSTRAGVLVWNLPREIYKMLERMEERGRSKILGVWSKGEDWRETSG